MKKNLAASIVTVALLFVGAGMAFAETPVNLSIGTASLGGNFFTMGAAMASVFTEKLGYRAIAQATGGSATNLDSIHNKELDMAISQAMTVASAVRGTEQFTGSALNDQRLLLNYSATPIHFLVKKSANINSLKDLEGKRVECMTPGDGIELTTKKFLPLFGVSLETVTLEYSGTRVQSGSRFKTLQLDALLDATGIGASWMADVIGDGSNYELISFSDEEIQKICSLFPEFSRMVIPANTYKGQDHDIVSVGCWTAVVTSKDMKDEVAYNIVKTLYENKEELIKAHSFFKDLDPKNVLSGVSAPVHPGAVKYY